MSVKKKHGRATGLCRVCGYRVRLRVNGTVQGHRLFVGPTDPGEYCIGAGSRPHAEGGDDE